MKKTVKKLMSLFIALSLCLSLVTPVVAAADPLEEAVSVGMDQTMSGQLSRENNTDLYRLDVQSSGVLNYKLKFYMTGMYMRLLDQDGKEIKRWYQFWDSSLQMGTLTTDFAVEPGTYYIQLQWNNADGSYTLEQTFEKAESTEVQPNDSLEQAQRLTLGDKAYGVLGFDDKDVYKVVVPKTKNITLTFTSKLAGAYLYLYDADGKELKRAFALADSNTGINKIQKIYKLPAGTYYLLIKGNNDTGSYSLKAAATAVPAKAVIKSLSRRSQYANLKISLKKASYAEGYQIYIASNSKFKNADKYQTTQLTANYHKAKGKTFYVKVRAYRKNSEGGYIYGKFSAVKKIKL